MRAPITVERSERYALGLDLGQASDSTAACVVRQITEGTGDFQIDHMKITRETARTRFEVPHLQRWPLRTPYPVIVADVAAMLTREPLAGRCDLVIDKSGVGAGVFDMFVGVGLPVRPIGVVITGGSAESGGGNEYRVAKVELISRLTAALHGGNLQISDKLPEAATLLDELANFRLGFTDAGNMTLSHRVGRHDDLLLALALGVWWLTRPLQIVRVVRLVGF